MTQIMPTKEALLKKWGPVINHKNAPKVESQRDAEILAVLLENQEKHEKRFMRTVLAEATYADPSSASGAMTSYKPILIPMMRRSVPQFLAMKIFGVQEMNAGVGVVFCLRPSYQGSSEANRGTTRKTSNVVVLADASAFEVGDPITGQSSGATGTVIYKEDNTILVNLGTSSPNFIVGENVDDASPYSSAETTVASRFIPNYSNPAESNEAFYKFFFKNMMKFNTVIAGEQATTNIKEVGMDLEQVPVTAYTHKTKAKYSLELAEDYNNVHGENAETDLMKIAGDALALEQNIEHIELLNTVASRNAIETFNYTSADGRWLAEKAQNFLSKINLLSGVINDDCRTGEANFIVATKSVINLMKDSGRYEKKDDLVNNNGLFNGKLDGQYDVYYNIFDRTGIHSAILGHIGNEKDTGIFFCPYVPINPIKTVDPENGNPILILRTRYGILENPFGSQSYYRKMVVTGIV